MSQSSTQPNTQPSAAPMTEPNKAQPAGTGPQPTEAEKKVLADKAAAAGNSNVKS